MNYYRVFYNCIFICPCFILIKLQGPVLGGRGIYIRTDKNYDGSKIKSRRLRSPISIASFEKRAKHRNGIIGKVKTSKNEKTAKWSVKPRDTRS